MNNYLIHYTYTGCENNKKMLFVGQIKCSTLRDAVGAIKANEEVVLGDVRYRRIKLFSFIAEIDVFQCHGNELKKGGFISIYSIGKKELYTVEHHILSE